MLVPEAHAAPLEENEDGGPISAVARLPETSLHPDVDVRTALAIFDAAQTDTLAVTERETGVVVGLLGEAFAARRYAQETDLAAQGRLGRRSRAAAVRQVRTRQVLSSFVKLRQVSSSVVKASLDDGCCNFNALRG